MATPQPQWKQSDCFGFCKGISPQAWNFLTPCVCICLAGYEDRYIRCAKEFCRVGLCRRVTFYRPAKHVLTDKEKQVSKRPGTIGCFRSHQTIAQQIGLVHGAVTVFEDDVVFRDDCIQHEPDIRESLAYIKQRRPNFFVYFLGSFPLFPQFLVGRHTARIRGALGTHALHYSAKACRFLADLDIYDPVYQKNPALYMIFGNTNFMPDWKYGFIGFDNIISTKENYGYIPMIAFQCANQCPATAQTTNLKGTSTLFKVQQSLINPTTGKLLEVVTLSLPILAVFLCVSLAVYVGLKYIKGMRGRR